MTQSKTPAARSAAETKADLQSASELVLERERKRKRRAKARARRQQQKRERDQLAAVERMQQSIEVIKWCIVGIATVIFLGIVLGVWTLIKVQGEVAKVQAEVEKAQPQVERIINEVTEIVDEVEKVREKLHNPMQSIGAAFGKELDDKIKLYVGEKVGGEN